MKTFKKTVGASMLIGLFMGIFTVTLYQVGLKETCEVFGTVIFLMAFICVAINLLLD